MASAREDVLLGPGPSGDEDSECLDLSDSGSVLSDDSVLPDYELEEEGPLEPAATLYQACARNQARALRLLLEAGVSRDQAMELDANGRVRSAPGVEHTHM